MEIYRYVAEGTFDSYLYQTVENKQRGISQIFTSKLPARLMQEIDETALSYAEIKALATGNPAIIERCRLDTEVSELRMLRSNYRNEQYELQDKILKQFPKEISRLTSTIANYAQDIALREKHTPVLSNTFPGMKIQDTVYTKKVEAGKKLLKEMQSIHTAHPVVIGEYKGFEMSIIFDPFGKEYHLSLKGTLNHKVYLGSDIYGNLTRIDSVLNDLEEWQSNCQKDLENTQKQLETAKEEVEKPFTREQELTEKVKRLEELNVLLNQQDNLPNWHDVESPENNLFRTVVALESTHDYEDADIGFISYRYSDGKKAERYRLISIGENGKLAAYPGMEQPFFVNEYTAQQFIAEHADELTVIPYEEMLSRASEHSMEQRAASQAAFESNIKPPNNDLEFV